MSKYRLEFSLSARRQLKKLDTETRKRVVAKAEALADDPRPRGFKKLEAAYDLYRVRERNYRIIYQIVHDMLLITVLEIGDRK